MDLKYYDLEMDAFSIRPDLDFLFLSESHEEAIAHMVYGLEQKEDITLIVGDIGTGKTLAIQSLLRHLSGNIVPVEVNVTALDFPSLVRLILIKLDQEPASKAEIADLLHLFEKTLADISRTNRKVVLVIDEAQNLAPDVLEGIRLLMNVGQGGPQVIQLVLVGQLGLLDSLGLDELRQLRQRIRVEYRFSYLNREETGAYIRHRLKVAGRDAPLFDDRALNKIHDLSGGVPRLVNYLASKALLSGFVMRSKKISAKHVDSEEFLAAHGASASAAKKSRKEEAVRPVEAERPARDAAPEPAPSPAPAPVEDAPQRAPRERRSRRGGVLLALLVIVLVVAGVLTRDQWLPGEQDQGAVAGPHGGGQVTMSPPGSRSSIPAGSAAQERAQDRPVAETAAQATQKSGELEAGGQETGEQETQDPATAPDRTGAEQAVGQTQPVPAPVEQIKPSVPAKERLYSAHVASFRDQARADRYFEHFKAQAEPCFIKVVTTGEGKVWYRVYLGPFEEREEARRAAQSLKDAEEIDYFRVLKMTPDR